MISCKRRIPLSCFAADSKIWPDNHGKNCVELSGNCVNRGYIKVFWADNLPYEVTINNSARTYNERLAEYEAEKARSHQQNFFSGSFTNNGNMVFGNVSGATLSVDNSIHKLERDIEKLGGDDKEELQELLDEVKELIENIQSSRTIPKQKRLFQRLNDHIVKHGWFYGGVVQLLGTAVMKCLGYA